jgi:hypothetical protein
MVELSALKVAAAQTVAYNRDQWKQWINVRPCWTTREAVIARDAVSGNMKMLDSKGRTTTDVNSACSIVSGKWIDPYTLTTFTNPSKLDIDHLVPLGYVAAHGGQAWSTTKKTAYANDLNDPGHLLAVSASANRAKGDDGPSQWKPTHKIFWC